MVAFPAGKKNRHSESEGHIRGFQCTPQALKLGLRSNLSSVFNINVHV